MSNHFIFQIHHTLHPDRCLQPQNQSRWAAAHIASSPPTPPRHIFVFIPQFSSSTDTIAFLSSWCLKLLKLSLFPRLRGSVSRWILSCERYILLHDTFGCKKFNKLDKSKEQLVFVSSKYLSPLLSSAPAAPESPGQLGPSPPVEWWVVATQVWSMKNGT